MSSLFSPATYIIRKPFRSPVVRGILAFLAFVLFLTGAAHWVGQSALSTYLPPPVIDVKEPDFNVKINYLNAFVREHGRVDCLLFGSSHVDSGLDPAVVEQVYLERTGIQIHCFNFGIGALTTDTAGPLLTALVGKYQPRLVIFEVSARSFHPEFGELASSLKSDPWILYQNGDRSLAGWALDNLYIYRYYLAVKTWQQPYNRDVMLKSWQGITPNGFSPRPVNDQLKETTVPRVPFKIGASNWRGFKQALALQDRTHLIFIEAPILESYLPDYLVGGVEVYENEFFKPVQEELSAHGISIWRGLKEVSPNLPDSMWYDPRHVNVNGSRIFSAWLGEKMAQEISSDLFR